jgi:D-alanyl-D-alanine carboxypeptidase
MFRCIFAMALCATSALVSCATWPEGTANPAIQRVIADNATMHGIPAQAVVVLHKRDLVHRQYTGTSRVGGGFSIDEKSVFPVFSISKLFASLLLLQLVEEGKVDLAAPASRYVAWLPPTWHAVTVEQLLSHVSGIPEYFDIKSPDRPFPPSLRAVFESLSSKALVEAPGTRTRYTNTNFLVIAVILESVTGRSYGDLVQNRIIAPLGLRSTWLGSDDVPRERLVDHYFGENERIVPDITIAWPAYSAAHGNVYSSADDLAAFLSAVAEGRFVSRKALMRFWKPYQFSNGNTGFASGWDFGKTGKWYEVGHDGGTKTRVRILFQDGLDDYYVVVYLTNGSRDNVWSRTLVDSVQARILPQ